MQEMKTRERIIALVNKEVVPAIGCTEPMAVALCTAKAATLLGKRPDSIEVLLSPNMLKNAMGVGIPGTGMIGLPIAVALGALIGKPEYELEVLKDLTPEALQQGKRYIEDADIDIKLKQGIVEKLYIEVVCHSGKDQAAAIIAGISVGTLVSLGCALALALALHLTQEQYATLLPKSVTTAISMDVAAELGGIAALTGAIVILTGIVGNLLAETVCKAFHITDPIAKGVGIGTSAHAVGTSKALQMGEVEGAMSGLSIAVAGVLTAVLCPVFVNLID